MPSSRVSTGRTNRVSSSGEGIRPSTASMVLSSSRLRESAGCTPGRVAAVTKAVAALVTPWNYPLLQAVLKVAPAVAAGCPFVLKPSPLASLTCVDFLQTILGPLTPPGACNLLTGGPPLSGSERGAGALLADPRVAVCSFTGSSRGGEAVLRAAAPFARPSALELGGDRCGNQPLVGSRLKLSSTDEPASSRHVSASAESWPPRHRRDVSTTAWRCGLSPTDSASTAARSPRD